MRAKPNQTEKKIYTWLQNLTRRERKRENARESKTTKTTSSSSLSVFQFGFLAALSLSHLDALFFFFFFFSYLYARLQLPYRLVRHREFPELLLFHRHLFVVVLVVLLLRHGVFVEFDYSRVCACAQTRKMEKKGISKDLREKLSFNCIYYI